MANISYLRSGAVLVGISRDWARGSPGGTSTWRHINSHKWNVSGARMSSLPPLLSLSVTVGVSCRRHMPWTLTWHRNGLHAGCWRLHKISYSGSSSLFFLFFTRHLRHQPVTSTCRKTVVMEISCQTEFAWLVDRVITLFSLFRVWTHPSTHSHTYIHQHTHTRSRTQGMRHALCFMFSYSFLNILE